MIYSWEKLRRQINGEKPCLQIRRLHIAKIPISPNWSVDSPLASYNPKSLCVINWQVILKLVSKYKEPRIAKQFGN